MLQCDPRNSPTSRHELPDQRESRAITGETRETSPTPPTKPRGPLRIRWPEQGRPSASSFVMATWNGMAS